ncbi:hypothetical protein SDC9_99137 [bioreactor metagenome]|uniref:Uncharacterized protein n=1 Tax=bioreactor metagenome TaxID=1076179 RepID=A0A645AI35_9ZZZZ
MVAQVFHVVGYPVVGEVEVVGLRRIFGRQCVYLFHYGQDSPSDTFLTDGIFGHRFFIHQFFDLIIREPGFLCLNQPFRWKLLFVPVFFNRTCGVNDVFQFIKEPPVNFCQFINPIHRISLFEGLRKVKDALVGGNAQIFIQFVGKQFFIA